MRTAPQIGYFGIIATKCPNYSDLYAAPYNIKNYQRLRRYPFWLWFALKRRTKTEETSADLIDCLNFQLFKRLLSIENHLKSGSTIWAWYKINDFKIKDGRQLNISALENLSYRFDGLTALRKEGNYLIYYRVEIDRTLWYLLKTFKDLPFQK